MIPAAALKTEVTTDPTALGLAAPWAAGALGTVRDLLNAQGVTATKQDRTISQSEFAAALVLSEYLALTDPQRQYLAILTRTTFVYAGDVKAALIAIFPATGAGTTRANLNKIINRNSSRAEVLWGVGTVVTIEDLAAARAA